MPLLLFLFLAAPAAAQPPSSPDRSASPPAQQDAEISEATALWLSIGGTAASLGVFIVGTELDVNGSRAARPVEVTGALATLVTPSLGHWYARSFATRGMAYRLLGAASIGLSLQIGSGEGCEGPCALFAAATLVGGIGMSLIGTVDDLASVPAAVQRFRHGSVRVAVVPALGRGGGGLLLMTQF